MAEQTQLERQLADRATEIQHNTDWLVQLASDRDRQMTAAAAAAAELAIAITEHLHYGAVNADLENALTRFRQIEAGNYRQAPTYSTDAAQDSAPDFAEAVTAFRERAADRGQPQAPAPSRIVAHRQAIHADAVRYAADIISTNYIWRAARSDGPGLRAEVALTIAGTAVHAYLTHLSEAQ